jgi:hypothetical protein
MVIRSRRMRLMRHVARMGEMRNAYNISVGKPERERLLRKSMRRWKDNIRVDLMGIDWKGMDSMHLAQKRDR